MSSAARARRPRDWQPRIDAIQVVDHGDAWAFRLTDRATALEVALLRLAYGGELDTQAAGDVLLVVPEPRDIPRPTREELVERLAIVRRSRGT